MTLYFFASDTLALIHATASEKPLKSKSFPSALPLITVQKYL